jgi:hypothetical protein
MWRREKEKEKLRSKGINSLEAYGFTKGLKEPESPPLEEESHKLLKIQGIMPVLSRKSLLS